MNMLAISPFTIAVDQDELNDLQQRLRRTRWPDHISGNGWDQGIDPDYLRTLLDYWQDGFDWRAHEARLNELDQFTTRIDGQLIHFLHIRSPYEAATPLLMIHGWPGSIVEFLGVIERLTSPEKFGGRREDACHLVLPSLPGYGFSGAPKENGWSQQRTGVAFGELMSRLGYSRFGLQGGDWGALVGGELALHAPGRIIGLHTNMPMSPQPEPQIALSAAERADVADMQSFRDREMAYALIQGTKPQTLGMALNDSPAGLCAWIVEKFRTWSDCGGSLESVFDRDVLLTNVALYWFTGTATSAARFYYEFFRTSPYWLKGKIEVPTGVARFPKEMNRPPRSWVEKNHHVVHWTDMPRGGHFAALEQPKLLAEDILAFFRQMRL